MAKLIYCIQLIYQQRKKYKLIQNDNDFRQCAFSLPQCLRKLNLLCYIGAQVVDFVNDCTFFSCFSKVFREGPMSQGPSQLITDFRKSVSNKSLHTNSTPNYRQSLVWHVATSLALPLLSFLPLLLPSIPPPNCSTVTNETLATVQDPLLLRRKYWYILN